MKTVNPYFLHVPLEPIVGLADDDDAVGEYRDLDCENPQQLKTFVKETLVPPFSGKPVATQSNVKKAYRYYLTKCDSDWDRVFYSQLPPFEGPRNMRDFFVVLYGELFDHEDYLLDDISEWTVDPNIDEV